MNIRKLNEELRILNEMDVDPSFKDFINTTKEKQRDDRYGSALQYAKSDAERRPDDDWYQSKYARILKKYMGKQDIEHIYTELHSAMNLDMQNATIKSIPCPQVSTELKKVLAGHDALILNGPGTGGKVAVAKLDTNGSVYCCWGRGEVITGDARYKGTTLDLSSPRSLSRAVNAGAFDKAWIVDAPKCDEIQQKRAEAKRGAVSLDRAEQNWHGYRDKSGYVRRDLAQELGKLKRAAFDTDYKAFKDQAKAMRQKLTQQIRSKDTELDLDILQKAITMIKDAETFNLYDFQISTKADQDKQRQKMTDIINNLEQVINKL